VPVPNVFCETQADCADLQLRFPCTGTHSSSVYTFMFVACVTVERACTRIRTTGNKRCMQQGTF
jgi:hypothetical protein